MLLPDVHRHPTATNVRRRRHRHVATLIISHHRISLQTSSRRQPLEFPLLGRGCRGVLDKLGCSGKSATGEFESFAPARKRRRKMKKNVFSFIQQAPWADEACVHADYSWQKGRRQSHAIHCPQPGVARWPLTEFDDVQIGTKARYRIMSGSGGVHVAPFM